MVIDHMQLLRVLLSINSDRYIKHILMPFSQSLCYETEYVFQQHDATT